MRAIYKGGCTYYLDVYLPREHGESIGKRPWIITMKDRYTNVMEGVSNNPIVDVLNYGFSFTRGKRTHNGVEAQEVIPGTTKERDDVHGGNSQTDDKIQSEKRLPKKKGNRRSQRKERQEERAKEQIQMLSQNGGHSMKAFHKKEEISEDISKIKEVLSRWIGTGTPVEEEKINVIDLTLRTISGQDITPAVYADTEVEQKMRILLTNDVSGSCSSHSGITKGIAKAIASDTSMDVRYIENVNGDPIPSRDVFYDPNMKEKEIYGSADRVVYFGDSDGYRILESCSKKGAKIVMLSNEHHNNRGPKVRDKKDNFIYIDGVELRDTAAIATALSLIK